MKVQYTRAHIVPERRSSEDRRIDVALRRFYRVLNAARLTVAAIKKLDSFSWQGCVNDKAVDAVLDLIKLADVLDMKLDDAMGVERGPFGILVRYPAHSDSAWYCDGLKSIAYKFTTRQEAEEFMRANDHIQRCIANGEAMYEVRPCCEEKSK